MKVYDEQLIKSIIKRHTEWYDLGPFSIPLQAKLAWYDLGPFRHTPRVKDSDFDLKYYFRFPIHGFT